MAQLIDGKAIAASLKAKVSAQAAAFKAKTGRMAGLAVVLVGDDAASAVYVASKGKATKEAGMLSVEHRLRASASEAEVLALVESLNKDAAIDGILVQLPLPKQIDEARIIAAIDPAKDVDGLNPVNAGALASGTDGLVPCTPLGSVILAKSVQRDLTGLHAVVIGRSKLVGKPVAFLLLNENCTVTMAHSKTRDLPALCRSADILVAAVGRPEMVKGDWVKPGSIVIDVGINRVSAPDKGEGQTRLVGDVDFNAAEKVAGSITPVPGGVGPMTIACLLANTLTAACKREGLPAPDWV